MSPEKSFWVRSMYGHNNRTPLVVITMPGGESTQMEPDDARALAANIIQAAEAAEQDAFIFEYSRETFSNKTDPDKAAAVAAVMLNEYRKWREKRLK